MSNSEYKDETRKEKIINYFFGIYLRYLCENIIGRFITLFFKKQRYGGMIK